MQMYEEFEEVYLMQDTNSRVMRIPVPVALIREMDSVITQGIGGYATRSEFIVDAIQERILELTVDEMEDAGPVLASATATDASASLTSPINPTTPQGPIRNSATSSIAATAITKVEAGFVVEPDENLSHPERKALFGLHNRDYPSLWTLSRLAAMATSAPIPLEDFYAEILQEAWDFGELLLAIESETGRKCTALFPTNPEKRKSAEAGFRMFAIGGTRAEQVGMLITTGPLFEWDVIGLTGDPAKPLVGLTASGWRLLTDMEGVAVVEPHPAAATWSFFRHLGEHAPADHVVFAEILQSIGQSGATRQDVLLQLARAWPDWSENEVSTNAAGYIARSREWGLVDPKQSESKYHLTPVGHEQLNLVANGAH